MVVAGNQVGSKVGGEKLFTACVDILFTVRYLGAFMWTSGTDTHSNMSLIIVCLSLQALVTLPSEQKIQAAVAIGNSVWVSVQGSPMVHLCHAPSGILITSIDCTAAIMDLLKRELSSYPSKTCNSVLSRMMGGCDLGGACDHINAFISFPYQ